MGTPAIIGRWHLAGMVCGSIAAAIAMHYFTSTPGHPVGRRGQWQMLRTCVLIFTALTPLFIGMLLLWLRGIRRFPAFETQWPLRIMGLLLLATVVAIVIDLGFAVGTALMLMKQNGVAFSAVWESPLEYPEFFLTVLAGTVAWAVLPRLFIRVR